MATVSALGVGGVPANGVSALLVDVTAISPTVNTFVTVYPDQTTRPAASSLNASTGEVISNSVVVKVGANGKIALHNQAGKVNLKLDVQGYFTTNTGGIGSGFVPMDHFVMADTRTLPPVWVGPGEPGVPRKLASGETRSLTLVQRRSYGENITIPSAAKAVMVDVAVLGATSGGWLTIGSDSHSASGLDYRPGNTSMGMSVKLKGDGSAVVQLVNAGSAIDVVITVQGYFTDGPTTGAGLRPVDASRLIDTRSINGGAPIAAGASLDVAVGGTNRLPVRGVAGVVLNATAVSPTASGAFSVVEGSVGIHPPTLGPVLQFNTGQSARSSLLVAKVNSEGKVRFRNASSGTVHLVVDLQGWFADAVTPLPIATYSRTSVLQAKPSGTAVGTIEYAFVDNLGQLRIGHQSDPDSFFNIQWTAASGFEALTGQPALNQPGGKPVQVAARHTNGTIWAGSQTAEGAATWGPVATVGGSMAGPPTATVLSDGTSVIFGTDVDGRLWHYRQSGTSPSWASLGNAGLVGSVTAVNIDTGLRITGTTAAGSVKTAVYTNDGSLSPWVDLGGTVTGAPAALVYPGYRTAIFARAADGSVVVKQQNLSGVWSSSWNGIGAQIAAGPPAVILDPVLGRTAVVVRGSDNEIYRVFEASPGSGAWGDWARVNPDSSDQAATDPTVSPIINSSGNGWVIVYRNANDATRVYERQVPSAGVSVASAGEFSGHTVPAPPA
ncbi:hypothetical protein DDE19_14950 [Micromonospora ureilytica]|uniref:PLL-like beta propeller domain-containing protein n=1 Tax=Micromonospora ureilytica TaxID=709868 RepID=A0A3N9Y8Y9_9ACTN|nr:hypothetical protein DDE19_14950 [Micromonospora ureilytica]